MPGALAPGARCGSPSPLLPLDDPHGRQRYAWRRGAAEVRSKSAPRTWSAISGFSGSGTSVLIADDGQDMCDTLKMFLEAAIPEALRGRSATTARSCSSASVKGPASWPALGLDKPGGPG